jgi:DNA-binding FadR family transcriptional regulator
VLASGSTQGKSGYRCGRGRRRATGPTQAACRQERQRRRSGPDCRYACPRQCQPETATFEHWDAVFHRRIFATTRNDQPLSLHDILRAVRNRNPWIELKRKTFSKIAGRIIAHSMPQS